MHFLFYCGVQFTIVVVQANNVLSDWPVMVSFEVVDQTIDSDHIFSRVTIEIVFEGGVDGDEILISEAFLFQVMNRSAAKVEKHRETS